MPLRNRLRAAYDDVGVRAYILPWSQPKITNLDRSTPRTSFSFDVQEILGCNESQWSELVSSDVMFELMGMWEEQKVRWDSESGINLRINFVVEHLGIGDAVRDTIDRFNEKKGQVRRVRLAQIVGEATISSQSGVCQPNHHL